MFIERTTGSPRLQYFNIPSTLFSTNFAIVAWIYKPASDSFQIPISIDNAASEPVFQFRMGGGNDNIITGRMFNTGGTSFQASTGAAIPVGGLADSWILYICQFNLAQSRIETYAVTASIPAGVSAVSGSSIGTLRTPESISFLTNHSFPLTGKIGCVAIRPQLFTLGDAVNMYNSADRNAPMYYNNASLALDDIIVFNSGVAQNPTSADSQAISSGRRIGSTVNAGSYIVYRQGTGIDQSGSRIAVRPVTVTGTYAYQYEPDSTGFFVTQVDSGAAVGTQGNSEIMARWGCNAPKGQESIVVWGNSRVIRSTDWPESPTQTREPMAYAGSWHNGIALHHLDNLIGVSGIRFQDNVVWPAYDTKVDDYFISASVRVTDGDLCRGYINSASTAYAPGVHQRLDNSGIVSRKVRELPGSKILRTNPMTCGVTYLRAPGCSNFATAGVEANAQNVLGTPITGLENITDCNTTQFTHNYNTGTGDSYNAGTLTLELENLASVPQVGWLVMVVAGTGIRNCAEIANVNIVGTTTTLTLRHVLNAAPVTASSILAFGPWDLGYHEIDLPTSALEYRGLVHINAGVAANEIGTIIYAEHCKMTGLSGFIFGMMGWGGNGTKPQIDACWTDVVPKMLTQVNARSVWLTDAYQGTVVPTDFPIFAALCESVGAECVYTIGQSNTINASQEINYRSFAFGQTDRPAICVTSSLLVGNQAEQLAYGGIQNTSHPSIETFVNVAEAMADLACANFNPGGANALFFGGGNC